MTVNMFKTARRASLALGVAWLGGCAAYAIFAKPQVHLNYSIGAPGEAPVRVDRCGQDDGSRYLSTRDVGGNSVDVLLCFKSLKAKDVKWWLGGIYSPEGARQMSELEKSFRLPPQGSAEAERSRREQRLDQWSYAAIAAVSGVVGGWGLVAVVGWVARGFLHIPRGRDSKRSLPPGTAVSRPSSGFAPAKDSTRVKRRTRRYD